MLMHWWMRQNVSNMKRRAFSMKSSRHATRKKSLISTWYVICNSTILQSLPRRQMNESATITKVITTHNHNTKKLLAKFSSVLLLAVFEKELFTQSKIMFGCDNQVRVEKCRWSCCRCMKNIGNNSICTQIARNGFISDGMLWKKFLQIKPIVCR